jgi:hypothetical protein
VYGIGCKVDHKKAEEYCDLGSLKGNKVTTAIKMFIGYKTKNDVKESFNLFKNLAENSESIGKEDLGIVYNFLG